MVFDEEQNNILCCKRIENPYEVKLNLVGGKIDTDEGNIGHMMEMSETMA